MPPPFESPFLLVGPADFLRRHAEVFEAARAQLARELGAAFAIRPIGTPPPDAPRFELVLDPASEAPCLAWDAPRRVLRATARDDSGLFETLSSGTSRACRAATASPGASRT